MAGFDEEPTEAEAIQFGKDHDKRVEAAREGMGYTAPKAEAAVEETEIEAPEVETEPETVETVTEEESITEEETAESDDTEEEEEPQPQDKSVFRQLNEIRSQKRQAEAALAEREAAFAKLQEENTALKANQPPPQPFLDWAKANQITDPTQVKSMYDLFRGQLEQDLGKQISSLQTKVEGFEQLEAERQEQGAYTASMGKLTDEWSEVLPVIEGEYKPNSEQLDQAFALMADLAHDAKYHDKELDYILYKEAPQFEQIFGARKRRTMFSSHGRASGEVKPVTRRDGSHESIMALRAEMKAKMAQGDGFNTVADGEI